MDIGMAIRSLQAKLDEVKADGHDVMLCSTEIIENVISLLKEQEAVEPYVDFDGHDVWRCGKCGTTIFHVYHNASDEDAKNYAKFCRHCGQAVKWK